jgi:Outer membrane protein beta-barrel domain
MRSQILNGRRESGFIKQHTEMKQLILCLSLFFSGYALQAQTEKGTLAVGGNVSRGIWNKTVTKQSSTQLIPTIGFFVRDNVLIGLGTPLRYTTTQFPKPELYGNLNSIRGTTVGLSLFLRRYLFDTRLKPFIQGDASYNTGTSRLSYTQGSPEKSVSGNYFGASAGLGASYFISNRLSVEATANLAVLNLNNVIRYRKLDPSNRFLLMGIGANWYWPTTAKARR